jgi:hypothetical protein
VAARPLAVPSAPRSLAARAGDESVTLSWQAPASSGAAPITAYLVQRWTGSTFVNEGTVGATTRTFRVTGLTNEVRYVFRVLARSSRGWSPPSNAAAAMPLSSLPYAPRPSNPPSANLDVVALTGAVTIHWLAPTYGGASAITHYVLQRSTGGTTWTPRATVRPGPDDHYFPNRYEDTGLALNTVYRYRVAAVNAAGQGPWGPIISGRTPTPCPDRSITGHDGEILVTQSFQHGGSCTNSAAQQDRIANKEMTWNPDGGWGTPSGTLMEPCAHEAAGSNDSHINVRYTCFSEPDIEPHSWFLITYPRARPERAEVSITDGSSAGGTGRSWWSSRNCPGPWAAGR